MKYVTELMQRLGLARHSTFAGPTAPEGPAAPYRPETAVHGEQPVAPDVSSDAGE
jgi:hypothetical protein